MRKPLATVFLFPALAVFLLPAAGAQPAPPYGTSDEAKAMLVRVAAALKADKAGTIEKVNAGAFIDRDLYPFCIDVASGKIVAAGSPSTRRLFGQDVRTLKDAAGDDYGTRIYAAVQKKEGETSEVAYRFPKPVKDSPPVDKVSYVTRIGDTGCGVGYYK